MLQCSQCSVEGKGNIAAGRGEGVSSDPPLEAQKLSHSPSGLGKGPPSPHLDRFDGWVLQLNHPVPIVLKVVHKLLLAEQLIGFEILEGKRNFLILGAFREHRVVFWGTKHNRDEAPKAQTSVLVCLFLKEKGLGRAKTNETHLGLRKHQGIRSKSIFLSNYHSHFLCPSTWQSLGVVLWPWRLMWHGVLPFSLAMESLPGSSPVHDPMCQLSSV